MILETSRTIIVQTRQYLMCFALYSFCSINVCTGQEGKTMSMQFGKKTADSLWVIFLSDSAPSDNLWNPILVTSHSTPSCSLSHISKLDFIRHGKSYQLWPISNFSIKHDLAKFCHPWSRFSRAKNIENIISTDYYLCYIHKPRKILGKLENFGKIWKFWKSLQKFENFGKVCKNLNFFLENFGFFWRISNYNFQSRRQIMTAKGVYESRTHFYLSRFAGRVLIVKGFVAKYIITCTWLWREGLEIFCPNKNYILSHKSSVFYHTLYPNIFQFHH